MTTSSANYFSGSFVAQSTLASSQYKVLRHATTAGRVEVASAGTQSLVGIAMNDAGALEVAEVGLLGVVKALAEASVAAGDHVTSSTTGRVKTTTSSNDHVLGTALEASSSAGDLIRILLGGPSNY